MTRAGQWLRRRIEAVVDLSEVAAEMEAELRRRAPAAGNAAAGSAAGLPVPPRRRGTRWGRASVVLGPALLVTAGFGTAVGTGALATQVSVQGGSGTLATTSLYGTDFGLVIAPEQYTKPDGTSGTRNVLRMAFANGQINGLCVAVPQTIGPFNVVLMLTATDNNAGTWEIQASNIVLDLTRATGRLNLNGVVGTSGFTNPEVLIGDDSSAITVGTPPLTGWGGSGLGGQPGWWGIKAGVAKFGQVNATVQELTILGGLQLPNLSLTVASQGTTCPPPPAPVGTPS